MGSNIACAVSGCTNPVIGQCAGYQGQCGRYYCADHSVGALCVACINRKEDDEKLQKTADEYLQLIKKLEHETYPSNLLFFVQGFLVNVTSMIFFGAVVAIGVGLQKIVGEGKTTLLFFDNWLRNFGPNDWLQQNVVGNSTLLALVIIFTFASGIIGFFGGFSAGGIYITLVRKRADKIMENRISHLAQKRRGLIEFYKSYKAEKQKLAWQRSIAVTRVMLGIVSDSLESSRREAETRSAVDDALRRHGL